MKNKEFFKDLYYDELKRKEIIDSKINYLTPILTTLIGAFLYLFKEFRLDNMSTNDSFFVIYNVLIAFFVSAIVVYGLFSFITFFNFFKTYKRLPSPKTLKEQHKDFYNHLLLKYSIKKIKKAKKKAIINSNIEFEESIVKYYIDYGNKNQKLNNNRLISYSQGKIYLTIAILSLVVIGILTNLH